MENASTVQRKQQWGVSDKDRAKQKVGDVRRRRPEHVLAVDLEQNVSRVQQSLRRRPCTYRVYVQAAVWVQGHDDTDSCARLFPAVATRVRRAPRSRRRFQAHRPSGILRLKRAHCRTVRRRAAVGPSFRGRAEAKQVHARPLQPALALACSALSTSKAVSGSGEVCLT